MNDSSDIFGEALDAPASSPAFSPMPSPAPSLRDPDMAEDALGLGLPVPVAAVVAQPYRVLARKYRSQTFAELIGQDAMVQTLGNAIKRDRLAHAFLMTGIRGVGKTSTARLIAKALNCIGPDGQGGPTIDPCGRCEPCVAIAEGRHIDVIEMDAASHTGVDDVREIIEAVRYSAVSARYKIYIIDEVHMLSRNAFNALLKTLEEPPAHVKFLFATTEVDKLPITVLSRCQRFDLKRIPAALLAEHFARICGKEGVEVEAEALAMVAEAAEGSVRDGLSILDQAIAHADMASDGANTQVSAEQVRDMLGLADKSVQRRLFAALLGGDGAVLLDLVAAQFALGVEPIALMRSAMQLVHRVTVAQLGKGDARAISEDERAAVEDWAKRLSAGQLHRLWQLLLKGHDEVKTAPEPLIAAEMALLRCLYAADMPDPGQLVKKIEAMAATGALAAPVGAPAAPVAPAASEAPPWSRLVDQVSQYQVRLGQVMRDWMQVVELRSGVLRYTFASGYSEDCAKELRQVLEDITRRDWLVEQTAGPGEPTLREIAAGERAAEDANMRKAPLVEAAMAAFPDAEFIEEDQSPSGYARRQGSGSR
jgi:DNA polymerase-3 subunit gamma/tau